MLRITKKAVNEGFCWTVWRAAGPKHPVLSRALGRSEVVKAKLLFQIGDYGVFWTYGESWNE